MMGARKSLKRFGHPSEIAELLAFAPATSWDTSRLQRLSPYRRASRRPLAPPSDTKTEHHIYDRSALPLATLDSARRLRSASNACNKIVPASNVLHVDAFAAVPLNLV